MKNFQNNFEKIFYKNKFFFENYKIIMIYFKKENNMNDS